MRRTCQTFYLGLLEIRIRAPFTYIPDLDESGSEYSGDEDEYEDEEWMTDSDEEEKVLKKLKRAQDDGNKEMYIARLDLRYYFVCRLQIFLFLLNSSID